MGYAWGGICRDTGANALDAFVRDMTAGDAAGITTFTTSPTINGSGVVTWSISHRPLTVTAATTRTGTTQLLVCDSSSFAGNLPPADAVTVVGFVLAFGVGIIAGLLS